MKIKRLLMVMIFAIIQAILMCCSFSGKIETKKNRQQMIDSYCQAIDSDADAYFTELSETACGIKPERIYYSITDDTPQEYLDAEPLTCKEILKNGNPRLIVGLHKNAEIRTDDDCYTEQEIRLILKESVHREIVVNLYFDNEHCLYRVDSDKRITIEESKGADGGAYRNTYEYILEE